MDDGQLLVGSEVERRGQARFQVPSCGSKPIFFASLDSKYTVVYIAVAVKRGWGWVWGGVDRWGRGILDFRSGNTALEIEA